ncbi:response regulator [Posidoniimonas polymericola]|nr:response regulator [Posidoniimonas polymericola]
MNKSRKFLVIDDSLADSVLLRALLTHIWQDRVQLAHCRDGESAMDTLENNQFDCVFLDYKLGNDSGLDVLRMIRDSGNDVPVIMMSGCGSEEVAVQALQLGSQDYVRKGSDGKYLTTESLAAVTKNAIDKVELERQVHAQEVHLQHKLADLDTELAIERQSGDTSDGSLAELQNIVRSVADSLSLVDSLLAATSELTAEREEGRTDAGLLSRLKSLDSTAKELKCSLLKACGATGRDALAAAMDEK